MASAVRSPPPIFWTIVSLLEHPTHGHLFSISARIMLRTKEDVRSVLSARGREATKSESSSDKVWCSSVPLQDGRESRVHGSGEAQACDGRGSLLPGTPQKARGSARPAISAVPGYGFCPEGPFRLDL